MGDTLLDAFQLPAKSNVIDMKKWKVKWSKVHDPTKWEKPRSIYCFHWKIAQWLEKKLKRWEIVFWMPPSAWCVNWGYYPNARDPEFFFVNLLFLEVRYFGAFNKKKACKKCGQEMPESNMIDK